MEVFVDTARTLHLHMTEPERSSSWFVKLPTSIGKYVLSKWLNIRSLGKLDSSFCSNLDRKAFFEVLDYTDSVRISTPTRGQYSFSMLRWAITRKLKCISFIYCLGNAPIQLYSKEFQAYLPVTAQSLKRVVLNCGNQATELLLDCIAEQRCSLNSLTICSITDWLTQIPEWHLHLNSVFTNSASTLTEFIFERKGRNKHVFSLEGMCLPVLRKIRISMCCDEDLLSLCKAAPNLLELTITRMDSRHCTNIGLAAVGQYCRALQCLEIAHNEVTTLDSGVIAIAERCPKLKYLRFDGCENLTDFGLIAFAHNCPMLEKVTISKNTKITDASLEVLAASSGFLRALSINDCAGVSGTGLIALGMQCRCLCELNIGHMGAPIMKHLAEAIDTFGQLNVLCMDHCAVNDCLLELVTKHLLVLECLDLAAWEAPSYTASGLTEIVLKCKHLRKLRIARGFESIKQMAAEMRPKLDIVHWHGHLSH